MRLLITRYTSFQGPGSSFPRIAASDILGRRITPNDTWDSEQCDRIICGLTSKILRTLDSAFPSEDDKLPSLTLGGFCVRRSGRSMDERVTRRKFPTQLTSCLW
jgi:hypothetical protein